MKNQEDSMIYIGEFSGKPRMVKSDAWKKRPSVLRYWEFKDRIKEQAKEQNFILGDEVKITFHIPMPKSWSKKKKTKMLGTPHKQRPDIDNLAKGVFDCLKDEDSGIHYLVACKKWHEEGSGAIVISNLEF